MGPGPAGPAPRHHDIVEPPKRRKAPLIIAGLLVMGGVGAWLGSQYTDQIFSLVPATTEETGDTATDVAENEETATDAPAEPPPSAAPQQAAATPTIQDIDRTMQQRPVWTVVKQQFPEWYQERVTEVARLSGENKSDSDITNHLIVELVKLRRENAKYALAASTPRHKEIASAFLANLRELASESADGCYEFISRGEASSVISARMQDPARSTRIEAQLSAILSAVAEGRTQPTQHARPVKTDYDLLAGELGRLGWTQADMQLFANPNELAKAPRERVCSMLQDWFAAHLSIQDASSQERLLFETLKPVVSG